MKINEFEVVCLLIWGLIHEPDLRVWKKELFVIIQDV